MKMDSGGVRIAKFQLELNWVVPNRDPEVECRIEYEY